MRSILGTIGAAIATLVGVVVLAGVVVVLLLQAGALNGLIEDRITAAVGRPARLEQAPQLGFENGFLTVDLGPLSIANAEWARQQHENFASIEEVRASLRVMPLLRGRVELPEVAIDSPQLHLARAEDGEVNWPEGKDEAKDKGGPSSLPKVENLVIHDADITYADAAGARDIALTLDEAKGQLGGGQDLALKASGSLQDAPLDLSASGSSIEELLDQGAMSKPTRVEATVGESKMTGQATSFRDLDSLKGSVEIDAAKSLTNLLASFGVETKDLPPFEAKVQVEPGNGVSLVKGEITSGKGVVRLDGKVDDLAHALDGFDVKLEVDAPELGPLLTRFEVSYADQIPNAKLDAEVTHRDDKTTVAAKGSVAGDEIDLNGEYQGTITAFTNPRGELHLRGSALGALPAQLGIAKRPIDHYRIDAQVEERQSEASPVKLDVAIEDTQVHFDGSVHQLRALKGVDGQVRVQGPDPATALDLFKLPAVSLPAYDFAGHVTWRGDDIKVAGLDGTFGRSDLSGDLTVDLRPKPPAVTGDLQSDKLVFEDLQGLIGARKKQLESGKLLPTAKIDAKAWRNLDLDLHYKTDRIESEYLPIDRIEAHVISKEGWLTIDPFRTGFADGGIVGFASLDGTHTPVGGDFDIRLRSLEVQDMLAKLGINGEAFGKVDGRIRMKGRGGSVDALLGSADGQVVLSMTGGQIDSLILEAIGLDIAESIVVLADSAEKSEEDKVPIRCAIVNLQLDHGVATTRPVMIDTTDSKITVDGTINLQDETLDIFIQSHPKDPSLFSANQPIHVDGKLLSPSVGPAPGETENKALGWLLAPIAAVLPFFDVGGEPDSPCGNLVAQAKDAAAARPE